MTMTDEETNYDEEVEELAEVVTTPARRPAPKPKAEEKPVTDEQVMAILSKKAPSATTTIGARRISVLVKHSTNTKSAGGEGWRTMEVTIEESRDGMDYGSMLDALKLAANDCVAQIAETLDVETLDVDGTLRFKEARAVAVAQKAPARASAPASRPSGGRPPQRSSGGGGNSGKNPPNYAPADRDALWDLFNTDPDMFEDFLGNEYAMIKPTAAAFDAAGIDTPREIKPMYLKTAPDWVKDQFGG